MKRKIEDRLLEWKNSSSRKPLLLNGARQVGKTYILRKFGTEHYTNTAYFNLESNSTIASFFDENISPQKLIRYLEASLGETILPGKTLIILDEIQACERAITSLKYFCEEAPEYHIAGAGSLLGVAVNRDHASFPVGKVTSMQLFPFDFEEYLWANEENLLCDEIRLCYDMHTSISNALHQKALDLYREYLIVGGMPASINGFLISGSFIDVSSIKSDIVNNYAADMAKYATPAETLKIRACFDSIPAQLGKDNRKFQYKIVQRGGSTTLFGTSLEWLDQSGLTLKCRRIEQGIEPLSIHSDLSAFKIYMSDVGLLVQKAGISNQTILAGDTNAFLGAVAENYVAQQLAAKGYPLYYWEMQNSQAELDFVIQIGNSISAIEVKSSEHVRSRSLTMFIQKFSPTRSIRLSTKNFGETESGIICIPLYAAFCI
jgi:predicted AAA+ superfamily ATPase